MTTRNPIFLLCAVTICSTFLLTGCGSGSGESSISTDSTTIAKGRAIFNQTCIACQSMDQDGIGPALAGITNEVSADWLKSFIKDAKSVIESGDARAVALHDKYKSIMPSFSYYKEDEIEGLVAYLNTHQAAPIRAVAARNEKVLENPIAESIMMSNLVIELKQIAQLPATSEQRPLTRVTKYFSRPDTKEFFVLDLRGKLYRLTNGKA